MLGLSRQRGLAPNISLVYPSLGETLALDSTKFGRFLPDDLRFLIPGYSKIAFFRVETTALP